MPPLPVEAATATVGWLLTAATAFFAALVATRRTEFPRMKTICVPEFYPSMFALAVTDFVMLMLYAVAARLVWQDGGGFVGENRVPLFLYVAALVFYVLAQFLTYVVFTYGSFIVGAILFWFVAACAIVSLYWIHLVSVLSFPFWFALGVGLFFMARGALQIWLAYFANTHLFPDCCPGKGNWRFQYAMPDTRPRVDKCAVPRCPTPAEFAAAMQRGAGPTVGAVPAGTPELGDTGIQGGGLNALQSAPIGFDLSRFAGRSYRAKET